MGVAAALAQYLTERGVTYDVVVHPYTERAAASAKASHVPAGCIAKAVVLKGKDDFMLAVLPASRHIRFGELRELVGRDLRMANEQEIATLFADCELGAVPALGGAYGLKVVVDDSLAKESDVYLEAGDHASLLHLSGATFEKLLAEARRGSFTEAA
jgi:Ala-tRNA(Pro) deacylase